MSEKFKKTHLFLDEAGDTTFFGRGKRNIIGLEGTSNVFILGEVQFSGSRSFQEIRDQVVSLQKRIESDPYFAEVPSIQKKIAKNGYYFHATDDPPEVRKLFFDFIYQCDCVFSAYATIKTASAFRKFHDERQENFYADVLSKLLFQRLVWDKDIVLNISQRGNSTKNKFLMEALDRSIHMGTEFIQQRKESSNESTPVNLAKVSFNVQNSLSDPLLSIADYLCWSVQRVFERGEVRYYNFIRSKIKGVYLFEPTGQETLACFDATNPLTAENKISPSWH